MAQLPITVMYIIDVTCRGDTRCGIQEKKRDQLVYNRQRNIEATMSRPVNQLLPTQYINFSCDD